MRYVKFGLLAAVAALTVIGLLRVTDKDVDMRALFKA
jgi:hypothetical protein